METGQVIIDLQYLPCIEYMALLTAVESAVIDTNDIFTKQTYRNRCKIRGANQIENLIIPIKKIHHKTPLTNQVAIDYQQKWANKHLRALQSAYGKAPFFEYYVDEIVEIYNKRPPLLFEFNKLLLTKCLEILELKIEVNYMNQPCEEEANNHIDARGRINPKNQACHPRWLFNPVSYFQVFGNKFDKNLSVIDLIFCAGPESRQILEQSLTLV